MTTRISLTLSAITSLGMLLPACTSTHMLDHRYDSSRPDYGTTALPNPGPDATPPHVNIINPDPSKEMPPTTVETAITGTWTFTTPSTTTRVERKTAEFHQFSIYLGRPAPTDTPFLVITVTPNPSSQAESDPTAYKTQNTRTYSLNGNLAKEWTGTTSSGSSFCELILSKPGAANGDLCHALALPKSEEQRKIALEILSSITWTPRFDAAP